MSLLVTNSRNMDVYLSDSSGVFQTDGGPFTRLHVINGNVPNRQITYLDKFDRCVGHMDAVEFSFKSARWDPNLVDNTSSQVGFFVNPEDNSPNTPYFVSAYDPSTTAQRLYTIGAGNIFVELSMADPEVVVDSNPFPKFSRNEAFDFSFAGADEFSFSTLGGARSGSWLFFPEIDLAVVANLELYFEAEAPQKQFVITFIEISTGKATPSGIPGMYRLVTDQFGRGPVFGETSVEFVSVQFTADDQSTANKPKGELMLTSVVTDAGGNDGRMYVKFVDFNPSAVAGVPNRIHLRETIFSRVNITLDTLPTGDPPSPLNGVPATAANLQNPNSYFTGEGSKRINLAVSNGDANGDTILVQASKGVIAAFITPPAPKLEALTNREVTYQCEVTGDLGEMVSNQVVDWSVQRLSTVTEVLATTPTPGETVTVANVPIDRGIEFEAGFGVFEDGTPLVEGGGNDFTVDEALGEITFISPKPLGAGEEYTVRYAHTAAPATPGHGTVIDAQVFTDINGIAQTRLDIPDDALLDGHLDQVAATTAT